MAELAIQSGWKFDELHTDDGRLDEVFRAITLPDTVKKSKKDGPVITVNV
jgi:ABC-2 type transport system ATP-binding protein